MKRAEEMSAMEQLQRLSLCIHGRPASYKMEINQFTENVPSLNQIWIHTIDMSKKAIELFAIYTHYPKSFKPYIWGSDVMFLRFEENDDE